MNAVLLSASGLALSLVSWITYFATVPSGRVPERPVGHVVLQLGALGLAVTSLAGAPGRLGAAQGASIGMAVVGAGGAGLFLWLLTQRRTPVGDLRVAVGDPLLPFRATTSSGATFDTASLAGQRVLLKFFRGSW